MMKKLKKIHDVQTKQKRGVERFLNQHLPFKRKFWIPMAGLEPARISSTDFESVVFAVPPHRHI